MSHSERNTPAPILDADDPAAIAQIAAIVRGGGVVVIPTDTVYGVAAALDQPAALAQVFRSKERPGDRTLPVLLGSFSALDIVSSDTSPGARRLMEHFWPGPLTLVIPAKSGLPSQIVGPGQTVGVRVPADRAARAVIDLAGGALAVTSANRSGHPEALDAVAAQTALGSGVDAILDAGPTVGGVASTVVRIVGDDLEFIRIGALDPSEIEAIWRA